MRGAETDMSVSSSIPSERATKIPDSSLDSVRGELKLRLDDDYHYPIPPKSGRPCCALCRWAHKTSEKNETLDYKVRGASVLLCDTCGVNLCSACFRTFHTVSDVKKLLNLVVKNMKNQVKRGIKG